MQITLNLPEKIGQELKSLPNPELYVSELVKVALQQRKLLQERPLGALKGHLTVHFKEDFKMTDEEFLQS